MAKRRRKSHGELADMELPSELGEEQLPEEARVRRPMAHPQVSSDASELDRPECPDRGEGQREAADSQAGEGVEGAVRAVAPNPASGPAEERLGDWPYRIVETADDMGAIGEWMIQMGSEIEKTPVGISATATEIALATKAQGWVIINNEETAPVISIIERALKAERVAPALVTRDTGELLRNLSSWFGEEDFASNLNPILPNIVHDMTALEYTTGRPIARGLSPLKDALDCAVLGPSLALEAPRFYREVGMAVTHFKNKISKVEGTRWNLKYDWLLFKVLAYYTKDPTLSQWLRDGRSPLQEFSSCLELDSKAAAAFLLWMVCGEDESLLSWHHPDWATELPDSPQLIKATYIDKHLPNLRLGLIRLTDQCTLSRRATTLYGRRSPWGLPAPELLHFAIMGSVDDILDVALVSLINMGSPTHWLESEHDTNYNRWLRAGIIGYTEEEPMEWEAKVKELGALNHPLGAIALEPKVSVE